MTASETTTDSSFDVDDIDLGDLDFWARSQDQREAAFALLRQQRPVSWHSEPEIPMIPQGPGFWAITRFDDVMQASRNPELFISGQGTNIPDLPPEMNELFGSMINMDAPRHTTLRRTVNRGFTPKMVARLEAGVVERARAIVDAVAPLGECDFVPEVAGALPLQVICDMMGIPPSEHRWIFDLSNKILGGTDPEYGDGDPAVTVGAGLELFQYALALGEERKANPGDDITSALMRGDVDGEALTPQELGSFFILLVVAGNETTRNAISHGLWLLTQHPDQRRIWMDDFEGVAPTAIEEIVRWATPVIHFRRTATADTVIGDQDIAVGDKIVLWYNSANRDEAHWDEPFRFDVRRDPNDHLGFGGGGPHFCLGAHLARREIKVMFDELFRRLPDIEATAEPDYLRSAFINGVKHLPVTFTPAG